MGSNSRRRLSFGITQAATVAVLMLVLAGGTFAAGRYVISSTKQISPKVLKALKGKQGRQVGLGPLATTVRKARREPTG